MEITLKITIIILFAIAITGIAFIIYSIYLIPKNQDKSFKWVIIGLILSFSSLIALKVLVAIFN